MDRRSASYKGAEPYVFVSYSHKDAALVHPELDSLVIHTKRYQAERDLRAAGP